MNERKWKACSACGSTRVSLMTWVDLNAMLPDGDAYGDEVFCNACELTQSFGELKTVDAPDGPDQRHEADVTLALDLGGMVLTSGLTSEQMTFAAEVLEDDLVDEEHLATASQLLHRLATRLNDRVVVTNLGEICAVTPEYVQALRDAIDIVRTCHAAGSETAAEAICDAIRELGEEP